ncbi:hypothetical protein COT72_00025 [archaeon CG10_big_fil_rev_8_21_14_0_10_43_11]|nr:MAG: hypothetical protein COT72_00025 [archaeon CG10_big_fil_rev_8_21_14_0_10_43_11]
MVNSGFDITSLSFTPATFEPLFEQHGLSPRYYEDVFITTAYANQTVFDVLEHVSDAALKEFLKKSMHHLSGKHDFLVMLEEARTLFSRSSGFALIEETYALLNDAPAKGTLPLRSLLRTLETIVFPNIERKLKTRGKDKLSSLVAQTKHSVLRKLDFLSVISRQNEKIPPKEDILALLPRALIFLALSDLLNKHADDEVIVLACAITLTF